VPVALAKRPVPAIIKATSLLSNTPGIAVVVKVRNTVAVGPCKYGAADIGQVADIEHEFRRSIEAAQVRRISPVDDFNKHVALVHRHSRNNCTRDNPVERDLVAG